MTGAVRSRRRHWIGLSAVEVLVATLILGAALLPMLTLLSTSSREASFDAAQVAAQGVALSLMESAVQELERTGFRSIDRMTRVTAGVGIVNGGFEAHVQAMPVDSTGWLWTSAVEVSWMLLQDSGHSGHSLRVERLISRPDACFTGRFPYRKKAHPGS